MVPPRPALLPPAERPGLTGRAISEDGGSLRQRWRPHDPLDSFLPLDHQDLVMLLSTVTPEAEPAEERGAPEPSGGLQKRLILRRSGLLGAAHCDEAGRVSLRCRVVDAAGPGTERRHDLGPESPDRIRLPRSDVDGEPGALLPLGRAQDPFGAWPEGRAKEADPGGHRGDGGWPGPKTADELDSLREGHRCEDHI